MKRLMWDSRVQNKGKMLLLISDKAVSAEVAKKLKKFHYHLTDFCEEPVQKVFDEVPHLIIIDENFNEGGGREVALSIKEDVVLKNIPILLLVENSSSRLAKEYDTIDGYVEKTRISQALIGAMREVLSRNHNELDLNPLTSLPGTRSSVLRVERAIDSKKPFAVCCVDLSGLTAFNQAYGDARGDEVIIRLAKIVHEAVKYQGSPHDFLGHLGGDDLIFVTRPELAGTVSEVVIQNFDMVAPSFYDPQDREKGFIVQKNKEGAPTQVPILRVSVAIVSNDTIPITEMSEISHIAGGLKKHAKTMPGSCYIRYYGQLEKKLDLKDIDSFEIRFPGKADSVIVPGKIISSEKYTSFFNSILKGKKIRTVYQPVIDLKTKQIIGYEALTRAVAGYYPADEAMLLFGVAREAGRVKELDRICVECALQTGQALGSDKKLFLNLNHETLIDPKFMKNLFSGRGVIDFKNIVIEVTEQSILRSFDKLHDALLELKEQGVSVAIDDLGGGAVSLRDVAVLKPDYIKFDRSLIRQIDTSTTKQQIVLSLILFAKGIHATTTAEGIETKEEYETTLMCGVKLGQGYYFARPGNAFPRLSPEC